MIHESCIYVRYTHSHGKPVNSHFISELPRSGSTLLAALLQNPRFYSAMTSPIGGTSRSNAGNSERRQRVFRVHFPWTKTGTAFYRPPTDREVICDTNRLWCSKLPLIRELFPDAKAICCVRNLTGWQRGWNLYGQSVKAPEAPKRYQRLYKSLLTIMIVAIAATPYSTLSTPEKAVLARRYLLWGRSTKLLYDIFLNWLVTPSDQKPRLDYGQHGATNSAQRLWCFQII